MVRTVKALNADGYLATVDILGELAKSHDRAEAAGEEYLRVMDEMVARGLKAKISVKLTQMGLKLDKDLCYSIMERVVVKAEEQNSFVRHRHGGLVGNVGYPGDLPAPARAFR